MAGTDAQLFFTETATPLGKLILLSDGERLCGAFFETQKSYPQIAARSRVRDDSPAIFRDARAWLERFFASAGRRAFPHEIALAPAGTPFQRRVWRTLCEIPAGKTASYAELASMLAENVPADDFFGQKFAVPADAKCVPADAKKFPETAKCVPETAKCVPEKARKSARAVASALARNPLIIFVPCHRVIAADGGISGFAGCVERKIFLLKLEGARFRVPAEFHAPRGEFSGGFSGEF